MNTVTQESWQKKELLQWVENELKKKKALTIKFDPQKAKYVLEVVKKYIVMTYKFFADNKNNSKMMFFFALMTTGLAVYFGIQLIQQINYLKVKIPELTQLKSYDVRILQEEDMMQPIMRSVETLDELIEEHVLVQWEINKYSNYLASLQIPYNYLLQHIYLPSLNVRKEKYTNKIDTNLMGLAFLENNPFNDIALLQQWWDFFKNLGDNNETSDILDMQIGNFIEDDKGFFSMPITVSFVANSKRAFLLLSDKLSMTSNKENISLINEFFYYLWNEIKKTKESEISGLKEEYIKIFDEASLANEDMLIGYHIYTRIFNWGKNILIDNTIIDRTIKSVVACNNERDELCYYRFRERYRDIPSFGYLLGTDFGSNGPENLKRFLQHLPPIFSIQAFEFDKIKAPTLSDITNTKYQGKVTILVYGRSASDQEVEEIALELGNRCLGENISMNTQEWLMLIQSSIVRLSDLTRVDKSYGDSLRELRGIFERIDAEYPHLSNYRKTIRLFEIYRMLFDAGLCK